MALKLYSFGPRNGVRPFHLTYQIQSANFWFTLGSSNASNSSRNATCTNVMLRRIIYWHLFFSYERNTRDGFMSWTQAEKFKAIQFARQAFQRKQLQNVLMLAPNIKIKKKLSFLKNFVFSSEIPKILLFPQRNFFAPSYYIFWHEEILCSSIGIKGSIIVCLFVCFLPNALLLVSNACLSEPKILLEPFYVANKGFLYELTPDLIRGWKTSIFA